MVIKVPLPLIKKKKKRRGPDPHPSLTAACAPPRSFCLTLYLLDVQSGSLWWYNQPPAEPALCSSPAALCPLELSPAPPSLSRMCVYTTLTPIHLFFLSSSPVVGGNMRITPSTLWGNSCRGTTKEEGSGCTRRKNEKAPQEVTHSYLLSVTEGRESLCVSRSHDHLFLSHLTRVSSRRKG